MTPEEAIRLAGRVVAERFPEADAAFAAGSIVRGEGTVLSDLDLVVLHRQLPSAWRESFLFEGTPVEAFVHDPETLNWFFRSDVKSGRPALIGMVAEGHVVGPRPGSAQDWRRRARDILAKGPTPIAPAQLDALRYDITDKVDDLGGDRSDEQVVAIGSALYAPLGELLLRSQGSWAGSAKWIPRLLRRLDPGLAERFTAAFQALYRGEGPDGVLALADQALAPHGGRLFEGDHRVAAETARLPLED